MEVRRSVCDFVVEGNTVFWWTWLFFALDYKSLMCVGFVFCLCCLELNSPVCFHLELVPFRLECVFDLTVFLFPSEFTFKMKSLVALCLLAFVAAASAQCSKCFLLFYGACKLCHVFLTYLEGIMRL